VSKKKYYDFLPNGWYFTIPSYREHLYDEFKLYTSSDTLLAYSCGKDIIITEGMEHESEYIKDLFSKKIIHDQIENDKRNLVSDVEYLHRKMVESDKLRKDFEDIGRPQPTTDPLIVKLHNFEKKLEDFKTRFNYNG
jgi:hypothetical protein